MGAIDVSHLGPDARLPREERVELRPAHGFNLYRPSKADPFWYWDQVLDEARWKLSYLAGDLAELILAPRDDYRFTSMDEYGATSAAAVKKLRRARRERVLADVALKIRHVQLDEWVALQLRDACLKSERAS